ncbi:TRAP transporter substrate-binding protein [Bacillus sp. SG-1]|uniref:TRAP transporter substrate-binding protein n=1 Tax=Bacillus sp. SG-1 TaxID=161544 RepID=UPI00015440F3|nr:TRAP transporter substrate-binding protein [Bacillus sp. SG-1]EDL65400.1 C4-dicarboxylate transport system substrate-binding protein [Bacillus sp. SG-1]
MKKFRKSAFILFTIMVLFISGCSGGEEASGNDAGQEYEWKMGWNSGLEDTPRGTFAQAFKDYIEKESEGRITIEFFPNETYATSQEMIEAVQMGALEMQIVGANMVGNIIPQYSALSLPFLTHGFDEAHAVLDGPIGEELNKMGEEHGMKVVGNLDLGFTQITNNVRPINTPEDLVGVKLRSPNDKSLIETFKAMGATVSTMAYTEIYNGLSQGVIDGQFNPLFHIFDQNMDEVQDYLAMTNHMYYYAYTIMNHDLFESLDEETQQLVMDAGKHATEAARQYVAENDEELFEQAKGGAFKEITYPELEPFQEAVVPVYKTMEDVMGAEIINDIQNFLEEYRKN